MCSVSGQADARQESGRMSDVKGVSAAHGSNHAVQTRHCRQTTRNVILFREDINLAFEVSGENAVMLNIAPFEPMKVIRAVHQ